VTKYVATCVGLYQSHHLTGLQALAAAQEDANREDTSPLGCTPHTLFELLEIYGDCGLLPVVGEYLGGEPVMFAERAKPIEKSGPIR
jgi:hypothetical protein